MAELGDKSEKDAKVVAERDSICRREKFERGQRVG